MKTEVPEDLSTLTEAELEALAAATDRVRFSVQLELHQRRQGLQGEPKPHWWSLGDSSVLRASGKRRLDRLALGVALLVTVAFSWASKLWP